jgi:hypothetical protein
MRNGIGKLAVSAGVCAVLALFVVVSASSAGPPDKCNPAVAVCHFSTSDSYGPVDTGIVCGSGAGAFDIFDQGVASDQGTAWLDPNGDPFKVIDHFAVTDAMFSNPLTGDVVPYTQNGVETTELAVPGDFSTGTVTITGENIYRAGSGTGKWLFQSVGRAVADFNGNVISSTPHQEFFSTDPSVLDQVCAALGA